MTDRETAELLKKAVAALEKRANAQPCDDAISRIDALNAVTMAAVRSIAIENIKLIPNTYQRPTTGRWIDGKCNICGTHAPFWSMASTYYCSNYCPNCGARMEAEA